jgi:hypothetical protein
MTLFFLIIFIQFFTLYDEPIQLRQMSSEIPSGYNIIDPIPNAFSPVTSYKLEFPDSSLIKFNICQGNDHLIEYQKQLPPGFYSVQWNLNDNQGNRVLSGVYKIKIEIISTVNETKLLHSHILTLAL